MSSKSGIFIELDGRPVDLDEVSWYEKSPCGCISGVHVAYSDYGKPVMVIATAEQAADVMWENPRVRAKQERLGYTIFADHRSKVVEFMKDCPHDPRWGVPPRPHVDGYEWAAVRAAGSSPKLMHLVPSLAIEDARERRYGSKSGIPLCGGKAAFWWSTEWYALDGKVGCTRCEKKATAAAEAVPA